MNLAAKVDRGAMHRWDGSRAVRVTAACHRTLPTGVHTPARRPLATAAAAAATASDRRLTDYTPGDGVIVADVCGVDGTDYAPARGAIVVDVPGGAVAAGVTAAAAAVPGPLLGPPPKDLHRHRQDRGYSKS